MQNPDVLEKLLSNFSTQLMHCNFDRAKDLCKKEKILTNSGMYKELLNMLPEIIEIEKCYSNLGFLSSKAKTMTRRDNIIQRGYEEIKYRCNKILHTDDKYGRMLSEIVQFTMIRYQLIDLYVRNIIPNWFTTVTDGFLFDVVSQIIFIVKICMYLLSFRSYNSLYTFAGCNKHLKIEDLLATLKSIIDDHISSFAPTTFSSMKTSIELEVYCLYDVLNAQLYLENWNLLLCTSHITSLKTRISLWEKSLHNKETWKVNFLRSNNYPELFRWMSKFKTFILEKFSVYFYTVLRQQVLLSDLKTICNSHHLEFLTKFQTQSKRFGHEATSVMLVFDACGIENWRGPGYNCPLKRDTAECPNDSYYIMLRHPERSAEPFNLMPTIKKLLVDHFSEILFLDKVVCSYLPNENATYFVTSIEEKISLVSYYKSRKEDKKSDIENFMLELACMIRCHRIFLGLNTFR